MESSDGRQAENPFRAPQTEGRPPVKTGRPPWHPLTWAIVGFAGGTIAAAPFILSIEPQDRIKGGMIFGGPLGAVAGLGHALARRRKARQASNQHEAP
ncbi:MAG: hypothetical protein WD278_08245 [Pirellulales bacterium]